jgi:ABC-type uncharacterized transport system YnjBCD permease subunit
MRTSSGPSKGILDTRVLALSQLALRGEKWSSRSRGYPQKSTIWMNLIFHVAIARLRSKIVRLAAYTVSSVDFRMNASEYL